MWGQVSPDGQCILGGCREGCGGSEIKHTGDGIMASFPSASRALECSVAIQRAVVEREDIPLRVRIGPNPGEPVSSEEDDLFGASVQLAKRARDHAELGQIVASDVVRQLAIGALADARAILPVHAHQGAVVGKSQGR